MVHATVDSIGGGGSPGAYCGDGGDSNDNNTEEESTEQRKEHNGDEKKRNDDGDGKGKRPHTALKSTATADESPPPPPLPDDNYSSKKVGHSSSWLNLNTLFKILFSAAIIHLCRPKGQKQVAQLYQELKSLLLGTSSCERSSSGFVRDDVNSTWLGDIRDVKERLLFASHKNLVWYDVKGDRFQEINSDFQVYYGMFPGNQGDEGDDGETVWVATSKLNTQRQRGIKDMLVQLNMTDGNVLQRKDIPSTFTHDVALSYDTTQVFIADTAAGSIRVFSYPKLELQKTIPGFTAKDHINTLAPTRKGTLWVSMMNHGGDSYMVEIDPKTDTVMCSVHGIGSDNHGLVNLDDNFFLSLSSTAASLVKIRIPKHCKGQRVQADVTTVWTYRPQSLWEKIMPTKKFLKGLVVVNEVAYFGMSDYQTSREARMNSKCSLLAYDLKLGHLRWIRPFVGAKGLLNIIGAPHLGLDHTFRVQSTTEAKLSQEAVSESDSEKCVQNYMNLLSDSKHYGPAFGMTGKSIYFIDLPLRFDVQRLRGETDYLGSKFNWTLRADVNNHFILLTTKLGMPADQSVTGPFYPVEGRLESQHTPYLLKVLDSFQSLIGRSRFMMLKAGETINRHYDRTEQVGSNGKASIEPGYWGRRFRVHIPIRTDQTVIFSADDSSGRAEIHMKEGHAYLFDNSIYHSVKNPSNVDRIHLIFDTIGSVELFKLIQQSKVIVAGSSVRNYWDTDGVDTELFVNATTTSQDGHNTGLVYENFTDSPVFVPMAPKAAFETMIAHVRTLISPDEEASRKEKVDKLLYGFIKDWAECYKNWRAVRSKVKEVTPALRQAELEFKQVGEQLVRDVLLIDECNADMKYQPLKLSLDTSMTLSTVVESFTRMMFYECKGWSLYDEYFTEGPPCSRKP